MRPQRRRFLALGARTLAGAGLALGPYGATTLARAASWSDAGGEADYRALVCVFLDGGSDGFSLLVPQDPVDYAAYARSRAGLAVDDQKTLGLRDADGGRARLALHPAAQALQPLYETGQLNFVLNVGNLVEPVTRDGYESGDVLLPAQLFSHSDQTRQWQQQQAASRGASGWGALAGRHLSSYQQRDYLTSITLAGSNYWQTGEHARPFSLRASGLVEYAGLDADNHWQASRTAAFQRMIEQPRRHPMERAYADLQARAREITADLGAALEQTESRVPAPPAHRLAEHLAMVARLIATRDTLQLRRQIYYVRMGGFDTHDNQSDELPERFVELAESLAWFQSTLQGLGEAGNVVTFTASDFGRSLASNGDGTDHGWGNHQLVLGDAVRGGAMLGEPPVLAIDGPDSVAHGRIVPTLAASQYAASLLDWVGLDDRQIREVLPHLDNFEQRKLALFG